MTSDRIGRHEVLLLINHNLTKFVICKALFFKTKTQEIPRFFFASSEKESHLSARLMARPVQLHCPIKAKIRAVDSQSDLRILL